MFYLIIGFRLFYLTATIIHAAEEESRLYRLLTDGYNRQISPSKGKDDAVQVRLSITFFQIISLNIKDQILTSNVWLNYAWVDDRLRWEPREHDNITELRFPFTDLWKPDVLLYNSANKEFDTTFGANIVVLFTGDITWIPPGILEANCKADITWYPFDEQDCELKFGSWTNDESHIDLVPNSQAPVDMSEYMVSGEFDIYKEVTVQRMNRYYVCCPESYVTLHFTVHLRRRPLYFAINLVMPCMLLTLMSILAFMLPSRQCQKITLQMSIILSIVMLLVMVARELPQTSESVPMLGIFFSVSFLLVSASIMFAVTAEVIYHTHPKMHQMGPWCSLIFLHWLPWLLAMERPKRRSKKPALKTMSKMLFANNSLETSDGTEVIFMGLLNDQGRPLQFNNIYSDNLTDIDWRIDRIYRKIAKLRHQRDQIPLDIYTESMLTLLYLIYKQFRAMTKHLSMEDQVSNKRNDWEYASKVIDRGCLILLATFIVISTLYLFFSAPYLSVQATMWNDLYH